MSSTASVGASNSAYASGTSRRIDRFITRADQNGDGQLSLSEFNAIGQNLPGGAATSSGSVTAATGSASAGTTVDRGALFGQIDTNGDGQLSAGELSTFQQQQLTTARSALLDLQEAFGRGADADGTGGAAGAGQTRHGHHHHHAAQASAGDTAATGGQAGAADASSGGAADPVSAFFSAVDANGDGSISKGELSSFVTQLLSRFGSTAQGAATSTTSTTV